MESEKNHLGTFDLVALILYFVAVVITGIVSMCRPNRGTVSGYFLAGRFMTWLPVGASLFASNIGSEHFIGLAGSGAAKGIGVGGFEFNACILLQLLGFVFLPVYIASGVCTLPEYMQKRFGGTRIQIYLSVLSLVLYIFTKISVNLYSGSLFIREALGWNIWYAILLLLSITALITVTGGLAAVIYTDTLQFFIMILGAVTLAIMSFGKVGGFTGLMEKYGSSISDTNSTRELFADLAAGNISTLNRSRLDCALPSEKAFVMLRSVTDKDMPWLGFLLGQTPASIWYWCADQMMVQRVLASKSLSHAQGATLFAGIFKLLPLFIMVMPGMISRILYPDIIGCATPEDCLRACGQKSGCTNLAYPKLVMGVMPDGLRGVMLAVMLAALMSDLTSIFNSASTLFTVDIYQRMRKMAKNMELMIVGRLFVIVMVFVSIMWIPVIQEMQGGQLFIYIQVISAYLAPPIAAVYLVAILWSRGNEKGAFTGLMYGLVIGAVRMIFDFVWREPACGEVDPRPWLLANLHYMYFALISFISTMLVMIIVSLLTRPPSHSQIHRLTFMTTRRSSPVTASLNDKGQPKCTDSDVAFKDQEVAISNGTLSMNLLEEKRICVLDDKKYVSANCEGAEEENHPTATSQSRPSHIIRALKRGGLWCCGLDSSETSGGDNPAVVSAEAEQARRIANIQSLTQSTKERVALLIILAILLSVTIFLFCFFSLFFDDIKISPTWMNITLNGDQGL